MLRPEMIDQMSHEMGLVYEACVGRCMANLAKYFRYVDPSKEQPLKTVYWQARKLAQLGQVQEETLGIIHALLGGESKGLTACLNAVISDSVRDIEPTLLAAVQRGFLPGSIQPELTDSMRQVFDLYYRQAADKANMVNTSMLDSTTQAYIRAVNDVSAQAQILSRVKETQRIIDQETGTVIAGVETFNRAQRNAVRRMVQNGLTGFVDHAGHRWRPETYMAMDIRTTVANTARQATIQRCEDFGSDLIQVSSHSGARPLCYPWQGKVLSTTDVERDVEDVDGNKIHVIGLHNTSYGQAAGLFGVNCGHFPSPFIPGFSALGDQNMIQPEKENEITYEQSQQQRALERKMRDAKTMLEVAKATGDPEAITSARALVQAVDERIEEFCDSTGRARHRDREYLPEKVSWPQVKPGRFSYTKQPFEGVFGGGSAGSVPRTPKTQTQAPKAQQPKLSAELLKNTTKLKACMSDTDYDAMLRLVEKAPTAKLYEKYADACRRISFVKDGGKYSSSSDSVEWDYENRKGRSRYTTLAHEMGHMFDNKIGKANHLTYKEADLINQNCVMGSGYVKMLRVCPSVSDQFLEAMRKDRAGLQDVLNNSALRSELRSGTWGDSTAGVQDAMDGFFGAMDKGKVGWGHGDRYYNRMYNKRIKGFGLEAELKKTFLQLGFGTKNQDAVKWKSRDYETAGELWANVISALTCGGEELQAFEQYMPNTVSEIRRILGELENER